MCHGDAREVVAVGRGPPLVALPLEHRLFSEGIPSASDRQAEPSSDRRTDLGPPDRPVCLREEDGDAISTVSHD